MLTAGQSAPSLTHGATLQNEPGATEPLLEKSTAHPPTQTVLPGCSAPAPAIPPPPADDPAPGVAPPPPADPADPLGIAATTGSPADDSADLDSTGRPWMAEIDSMSRGKCADGQWRRKRGVREEDRKRLVAAWKAGQNPPRLIPHLWSSTSPPPSEADTAPVDVPPPPADAETVRMPTPPVDPTPVSTPPSEAETVRVPTPPVDLPQTYAALSVWLMREMGDKRATLDQINEVAQQFGFHEYTDLAQAANTAFVGPFYVHALEMIPGLKP